MKRPRSESGYSTDHAAESENNEGATSSDKLQDVGGAKIGTLTHQQNVMGHVYNTYNLGSSDHPSVAPASNATLKESPKLSQQQRFELLNFSRLETRHATIRAAHKHTCAWLPDKAEYQSWLDPDQLQHHHGFLWIKGKPAAGKSTAMKFMLANEKKVHGKIVIAFFFNARGVLLEKSVEGLYRSLLFQLLTAIPRLRSVLDDVPLDINGTRGPRYHLESLQDMIKEIVRNLNQQSLILFIDALDECDEEEVRSMIQFFKDLGRVAVEANQIVRVCLSTRHYPYISIQHDLSLILEDQNEHNRDIERYIDSELYVGDGDKAGKIRQKILDKASGIFLWVALVVPMLNKAYDRGRMSEMEILLERIPPKLEDLFDSILHRESNQTRDPQERKEMEMCLLWVLHAFKPLSPRELYCAHLITDDKGSPKYSEHLEFTDSDCSRFILDCSRGLLEESRGRSITIQFIHESVREYMLRVFESAKLNDARHRFSITSSGQAHHHLTQSCWKYLQQAFKAVATSDYNTARKTKNSRNVIYRTQTQSSFPLIEYALEQIFHHSNRAQYAGISQDTLLTTFELQTWVVCHNMYEKREHHRYPTDIDMLYVLAAQDLLALLKIAAKQATQFDKRGGFYGFPLWAAKVNRSKQALKILLHPSDNVAFRQLQDGKAYKPTDDCIEFVIAKMLDEEGPWSNFSPAWHHPIGFAVDMGCSITLKCLLATGKYSPCEPSGMCPIKPLMTACAGRDEQAINLLLHFGGSLITPDAQKALHLASTRGYTNVLRTLLKHGILPDEADAYGVRPLQVAMKQGHTEIVRILLSNGAIPRQHHSLQARNPFRSYLKAGDTAAVKLFLDAGFVPQPSQRVEQNLLEAAVLGGDCETIRLLLANLTAQDLSPTNGAHPLVMAANRGRSDIVRLLLDAGILPNCKDRFGSRPLVVAARVGHKDIVQALLDANAPLDAIDTEGMTALAAAAGAGHEDIVKLLLDAGSSHK